MKIEAYGQQPRTETMEWYEWPSISEWTTHRLPNNKVRMPQIIDKHLQRYQAYCHTKDAGAVDRSKM